MFSLLYKIAKYTLDWEGSEDSDTDTEAESCDMNLDSAVEERKNVKGKVTHLHDHYGFINRCAFFDYTCVLGGIERLEVGSRVVFLGYRNHKDGGWRVVTVTPCEEGSNIPIDTSEWIDDVETQVEPQAPEANRRAIEMNDNYVPLPDIDTDDLYKNKRSITITDNASTKEIKISEACCVALWIRNQDPDNAVQLVNVYPKCGEHESQITVLSVSKHCNVVEVKDGEEFPIVSITNDAAVKVSLECYAKTLGRSTETVIFDFGDFVIGRKVHINVFNPVALTLNPTEEYVGNRFNTFTVSKQDIDMKGAVPGRRPGYRARNKNYIPVKLKDYPVDIKLKEAIEQQRDPSDVMACLRHELTFKNYTMRFDALLHLESIQQEIDLQRFAMHRVCFEKKGNYLSLSIPSLSEGRPSLVITDKLLAFNPINPANSPVYTGVVHEVRMKEVMLQFSDDFHRQYDGEDYNVTIELNRLLIRRQHNAIHQVSKLGETVLFPSYYEQSEYQTDNRDSKLKIRQEPLFYNDNLNHEQKSAVTRILQGEARPTPYILFGPPGTGKTMTLVEVVLQLYRKLPRSRMLLAAPSNSAADILAERLIDTGAFQTTDMVRMNAFTRQKMKMSEKLEPFVCYPENIDEIIQYRLIIVTCHAAGSLFEYKQAMGSFTHVIVDEAGQASEPEVMIPVCMAIKRNAQIILAGDPLQLGAVIMSSHATEHGLDISLLERLTTSELYARDDSVFHDTGSYNPLLVTKLIQNYRCHPVLLDVPSRLFYHSELLVAGNADLQNSLCTWSHLPNKNECPLLFHGMRSKDQREGDSPSWFNAIEAFQVVTYLQSLVNEFDLSPDDIGIITPYRKQVEKIRLMIKTSNLEMFRVGSVEEYQGQEKKVILISTVRSTEREIDSDVRHHLGFLSNPKRFNVAITRAQALLVIIGNPHVLARDKHWRELLLYAVRQRAYHGCDLPADVKAELDAQPLPLNLNNSSDQSNTGSECSDTESTAARSCTAASVSDAFSVSSSTGVASSINKTTTNAESGGKSLACDSNSIMSDSNCNYVAKCASSQQAHNASATKVTEALVRQAASICNTSNEADHTFDDYDEADNAMLASLMDDFDRLSMQSDPSASSGSVVVQHVNRPATSGCVAEVDAAHTMVIEPAQAMIAVQEDLENKLGGASSSASKKVVSFGQLSVIQDAEEDEKYKWTVEDSVKSEWISPDDQCPGDGTDEVELEEVGGEVGEGTEMDQQEEVSNMKEEIAPTHLAESEGINEQKVLAEITDLNLDDDFGSGGKFGTERDTTGVCNFSGRHNAVPVMYDSDLDLRSLYGDSDQSEIESILSDPDEVAYRAFDSLHNPDFISDSDDEKANLRERARAIAMKEQSSGEFAHNDDLYDPYEGCPEAEFKYVKEGHNASTGYMTNEWEDPPDYSYMNGADVGDYQHHNESGGEQFYSSGLTNDTGSNCDQFDDEDDDDDLLLSQAVDNLLDVTTADSSIVAQPVVTSGHQCHQESRGCNNSVCSDELAYLVGMCPSSIEGSMQGSIHGSKGSINMAGSQSALYTDDVIPTNSITVHAVGRGSSRNNASPRSLAGAEDAPVSMNDMNRNTEHCEPVSPLKFEDVENNVDKNMVSENGGIEAPFVISGAVNTNCDIPPATAGTDLSPANLMQHELNSFPNSEATAMTDGIKLSNGESPPIGQLKLYNKCEHGGARPKDKKHHKPKSPSEDTHKASKNKSEEKKKKSSKCKNEKKKSDGSKDSNTGSKKQDSEPKPVEEQRKKSKGKLEVLFDKAMMYGDTPKDYEDEGGSQDDMAADGNRQQQPQQTYKLTALDKRIIRQIEYYFGTFNLHKDEFMLKHMRENKGWIAMSVLMTFNKLKQLSTDADDIVRALRNSNSSLVQVSADDQWVRRPKSNPLPADLTAWKTVLARRTVYVEGLPTKFRIRELSNYFERRFGKIEHVKVFPAPPKAWNNPTVTYEGRVLLVFVHTQSANKLVKSIDAVYEEAHLTCTFREDNVEALFGGSLREKKSEEAPTISPDKIESHIYEAVGMISSSSQSQPVTNQMNESQLQTDQLNQPQPGTDQTKQPATSTQRRSPSPSTASTSSTNSMTQTQQRNPEQENARHERLKKAAMMKEKFLKEKSEAEAAGTWVDKSTVRNKQTLSQDGTILTAEQWRIREERIATARRKSAQHKQKQYTCSSDEGQSDLKVLTVRERSMQNNIRRLTSSVRKQRLGGHMLPKERPPDCPDRGLHSSDDDWVAGRTAGGYSVASVSAHNNADITSANGHSVSPHSYPSLYHTQYHSVDEPLDCDSHVVSYGRPHSCGASSHHSVEGADIPEEGEGGEHAGWREGAGSSEDSQSIADHESLADQPLGWLLPDYEQRDSDVVVEESENEEGGL